MKKHSVCIIIAIISLLFFPNHYIVQATDLTLSPTTVQVYFSPNGGCTEAIISQINNTKSEILVQAYSFTSAPITKALVAAHKRGVKVQAILDKSQRSGKYTSATFLTNAGISTYIDTKYAIAHNKIMISDREIVITGSFNFTKAAEEKNAENVLIIRDRGLAKIYIENWEKHKGQSDLL